jgi:serine/threonine-protein kinase
MSVPSGTHLGPYEVISRIGAGGMGEVYRARDTRLGRLVAIKILPARFSEDGNRLARFEQEACSASALNHPNIITIYDIGSSESGIYIAMELIEGRTLREILNSGPVPLKKAIHIGAQLADGLARAHEAGIIHRDLKPENFMIRKDGFAKILDFGLAKISSSKPEEASFLPTSPQTDAGIILGTAAYMSPEQASGQPVDFRSDQFSFGTILYEMVTGKNPFNRKTTVDTLSAIINEESKPVSSLNPQAPPPIQWIIERCMAKNSEDRYGSTRDLAKDIQNIRYRDSEKAIDATYEMPPSKHAYRSIASLLAALVFLLVMLFAFNIGGLRDRLLVKTNHNRLESIAVLPLENLSGDKTQDYFADGMTEALITELAKIKALRVISRTSVMQYKGKRKPLPEIARELRVDAIVEGSVIRSEDKVRITAQVIDVSTDTHLWAEQFDRDLRDVLNLQREVARTIARQIGVNLTPQEKSLLANYRPILPEANEAYLRGLYYFNEAINKTIEEEEPLLKKSFDYFQQAIEMEPDFAPAYAALARSYHWLASEGFPEFYPKAKAAALKSLEIDEKQADAHGALAYTIHNLDWDWEGAERHYKRAIELNPSLGNNGHHGYALYLSAAGRHVEAIAEIKLAEKLDPLTIPIKSNEGWIYLYARQYDRAIEEFRNAQKMNPQEIYWIEYGIGSAYLFKKMCPEALSSFRKIAKFMKNKTDSQLSLAYVYAFCGMKTEALNIIKELKNLQGPNLIIIAAVYSGLGDKDQAFLWLQKACNAKVPDILNLKVMPQFDSLHSDPRFEPLLQRIGIPQ